MIITKAIQNSFKPVFGRKKRDFILNPIIIKTDVIK